MKFDYGQIVIVVTDAPDIYRPGALGAICGMSVANSEDKTGTIDAEPSHDTYTVEYSDGSSSEVPEKYLLPYMENEIE